MSAFRVALAAGLLLVAAGCGTSSSTKPPARHFSAAVTNPWFPLKPGAAWVYRGVKDGEASRDVVHVTSKTRVIEGAPCVGVADRLYVRGKLEERTTDWYTQDQAGNVWYFGEATAELDPKGNVKNTEGSWLAGVKGAKPGIFMFARPTPGRSARQEYLKGHAEDHFVVLRRHVRVRGPCGSSREGLLPKEGTPLEPGVIDHKYYVRGLGTVLE